MSSRSMYAAGLGTGNAFRFANLLGEVSSQLRDEMGRERRAVLPLVLSARGQYEQVRNRRVEMKSS